ncbi:FAD:protein FMN transferase [Thermovenabulum gondwanense]|uniref:FAD:protein FMN transferase n=1 Tax=Thermovenabulum gondwanense TaxID=520767 RepID=A0A162MAM3_9FIRM|nr:FAD:protein FMN transferase [Thermovenabulum gondwanense]
MIFLTSCGKKEEASPVTKTNFLLDTLIQITAYGDNAESAINSAFDRIAEIHNKMNVNDEESEISSINKLAGRGFAKVSQDTFYVIQKGLYYSSLSHGKFDITIGPLVKLWGIGTERARVPDKNVIESVLPLINYQDVIIDQEKKEVMLKREKMALDLGAIAKGYAADEVMRILKENGIKSAVADLGGNIYVLGTKPNGKSWRIGIQNPFKQRGITFATIEVKDKTIVTSGTYERFFVENGKKYHHILDTKNGYPVENGLVSVTIIGDTSIDCDALSTTTFALGLKEGMKLIENIKGYEAIFVTQDKKVYVTSGVNNYNFTITDEEFKLENL